MEHEHSHHVSFIYKLEKDALTFADPDFKAFFSRDPGELSRDELLLEVVPQDRDYVERIIIDVVNGALLAGFEFRMRMPAGYRWVRMAPVLSATSAGPVLFGVATDITTEIQNELTVQKYANKKNSVLNILAHDLRGPLGAANMLSEMIGQKAGDVALSGAARKISLILKQSLELINGLLDREFLDSMSIGLVKKRVDIALKIGEYMGEYRRSGWIPERTFRFSASPDSIFLSLDEAKFMQVMNNLTTNALKFTRKHGIIAVNVTEQPGSVLITFSDDGIGIPPEFHALLFDKFTPARRPGLNGEPTLGMGMSVVKTIIDWHQGKIRFESEINKGTTFFIELPKEDNSPHAS